MIAFTLYLGGSFVLCVVGAQRRDPWLVLASSLFIAGGVAGLVGL